MSRPLHPGRRGALPIVRMLIALLLLSPLGVAIANFGLTEAEHVLAAAGEPIGHRAAPVARHAIGAPRPLLGFALNCHHIGNLPLYLESVDSIAAMGANTLIVVTPMYQHVIDSTKIRRPRSRCPTDQQLTAILRRAKQHELYTVLMPIVLIEDPGEDDWRGLIQPSDWNAWWTSYRKTFGEFATLAAAVGVDLLCVGSELNSAEPQVDRWRTLVADVRTRFSGPVAYSANWDRYDRVELWPLVDVMGVSAYFELERNRPGAPVEDLVRAWAPIRENLLAAAMGRDKPLLLSEVGYPSLPWSNAHPWNYVADDGTLADHAAQARSWRAFFEAWEDPLTDPHGDLLGFCGYRWDPYHQGNEHDTGYGIRGKPALHVIQRGFARVRQGAARRAQP